MSAGREQAADWERQWAGAPLRYDKTEVEVRRPRWKAQDQLVPARFGGLAGLDVIKIGAGRGTNGFLCAQRGANVALLGAAPLALEQAQEILFPAPQLYNSLVDQLAYELLVPAVLPAATES